MRPYLGGLCPMQRDFMTYTDIWRILQPLLGCLCLLLGVAGPAASAPAKLKVAVSILPQAYFVERIGADRVDIQVIMPKYADHDTYEPTPKQLIELSHADVYVKIGLSHFMFEKKIIEPAMGGKTSPRSIDMSQGIAVLEDDPHIWMSPNTARISVLNIYRGMCATRPSERAFFKKNLDVFLKELDQLGHNIQVLFSGKEGRTFIVDHPVLGYLADRYGLRQMPIEVEGKAPSALHLRHLIDYAKKKRSGRSLCEKDSTIRLRA